MALVALIQCLIFKINEELDENCQPKWTEEHHWIAPENHWIAARDGLEGMIITNLQGKRQKISDAILELMNLLLPIAKNLNCQEELLYLINIIENGNGAQRQRRTYNEKGSLKEVVTIVREEFKSWLPESCSIN